MNHLGRRTFVVVTVFLILAVWSYRAHIVSSASEYAPRAAYLATAPPETDIQVYLVADVSQSIMRGDILVGLVSRPVMINGELAIPASARLLATVEQVQMGINEARVRLNFNRLGHKNQEFRIQTVPVDAVIPVRDDLEVLAKAFDVTTEAAVGTAIGAASDDAVVTALGMFTGAAGAGLKTDRNAPVIAVRLTQFLRLTS